MSEDTSMVGLLVLYKVQPEMAVKTWLERTIKLLGWEEMSIGCSIVYGHPLFGDAAASKGADTAFPRIGVEWIRDEKIQTIGNTYKVRNPGGEYREALLACKQVPKELRNATDQQIDTIANSHIWETWIQMVDSEVVLGGFGDRGGAGRATMKRIVYPTIAGLMYPMADDVMRAYKGVKVRTADPHEVSVTMETGGVHHGFEIPVTITMPRLIIRGLPRLFPDGMGFDIHLTNSKTEYGPTQDIFDYMSTKGNL